MLLKKKLMVESLLFIGAGAGVGAGAGKKIPGAGAVQTRTGSTTLRMTLSWSRIELLDGLEPRVAGAALFGWSRRRF